MRTLKFNVRGQTIRKDPSCDFKDLVKGSAGYLKCQFTFDSEWDGYNKVAEFCKNRENHPISVLVQGGVCEVPDSIAEAYRWNVRIVGGKGAKRLRTASCEVTQKN